MNTSASKLETYSIKNSATLEEIRESDIFNTLGGFINNNGIEREDREMSIIPNQPDNGDECTEGSGEKISKLEYLKIFMNLYKAHLMFSIFARKNYKGAEDLFPIDNKLVQPEPIGIDFDFEDKYRFLQESILSGMIEGFSLNELRNLKQALNNQICLYLFELFLKEISDFQSAELPCLKKNGDDSIGLYPISLKQFVRVNDPKGNLAITWKRYNISPHIIEFSTSIIGRIKLLTADNQFKIDRINSYIELFTEMIVIYFDTKVLDLFQGRIGEDIQDIVELYLFLENFIMAHTGDETSYGHSSITKVIIPNTNRKYLCNFISEQAVKKGNIPDLEDISTFLQKQTKHHIKRSNSRKSAHMYNTNQVEFDTKQGIFAAVENGTWDDVGKDLDLISGCPFAKSQVGEGKNNAFLKMFETFDNYFLMIIEELYKRGFK